MRKSLATRVGILILCLAPTIVTAEMRVPLLSPWMDEHDRVEAILCRLRPEIRVERFRLEREGSFESLDWFPAFGEKTRIPLDGPLVILESAPASALARLEDANGRPLDEALEAWIRAGGQLLIIGGSPSLESYRDTRIESWIGFRPDPNGGQFLRSTKRPIPDENVSGLYIQHLHHGHTTTARVRLRAGGVPFIIENRLGEGTVTTILAGAQGKLRPDGPEDPKEWFASVAWETFLRTFLGQAFGESFSVAAMAAPPPARAPAKIDAFDIRAFAMGNQPYPYTLAPGEARAHALELRRLGFTSVVFTASGLHLEDDLESMREIADAGLRIVYYHTITRTSPKFRFESLVALPPRARDHLGRDQGWDVHSDRFRQVLPHLMDGREEVFELPLRAFQVIEEFPDGGMTGPSLRDAFRAQGLKFETKPGDAGWLAGEAIRADATAYTFLEFRKAASELFPGLPLSTYLPGSYWGVPHHYTFRLTGLSDAADELLAPGYGYSNPRRGQGPASVIRSASEAWAALQTTTSSRPHLAVYALGRPLVRGSRHPTLASWTETAWTAVAHGATGLAYWALPRGPAVAGLAPLHAEFARLGPWLAALPRTAAPVALLESWTTRNEGDPEQAAHLSLCLQRVHEALELGFEDVDVVFEERLDKLSKDTRAIVVVATPAVSEQAVSELVRFVREGGDLFVEPGSLIRSYPGSRPIDLLELTSRPDRVHSISPTARCLIARFTPWISAPSWQKDLQEIGLTPRVTTPELTTTSALRGGEELWHLYMLNHGDHPARIRVRLDPALQGLNWVELRSGKRAISQHGPELVSAAIIAPGEAEIWASVRRPAASIAGVIENEAEGMRLVVSGKDAAGNDLTDGYPFRIVITSPTRCAQATSAVVSQGSASVALSCESRLPQEIVWTATDPLTGRSASFAAGDSRGELR